MIIKTKIYWIVKSLSALSKFSQENQYDNEAEAQCMYDKIKKIPKLYVSLIEVTETTKEDTISYART